MPTLQCEPCCNVVPLARSQDTYRQSVLLILCAILGASEEGVRYDWETLCDPTDDSVVFVRFAYDTDGTIIGSEGFRADGDPYVGDLNALIECSTATIPGLLHAEDTPALSGDEGVGTLFKRTDTPSAQTDADGDYTLGTANARGAQYVAINAAADVTQALSLLKLEDSLHASGDAVVGVAGVAVDGTLVNRVDLGDYVNPSYWRTGTALCDINTIGQPSTVKATSILKQADAASDTYAAGIAGPASLGVVQTLGTGTQVILSSTSLRYNAAAHNLYGASLVDIQANLRGNTTTSPVRLEDEAFSEANAVIMAGAVNNRAHTAFNTTSGDITPIAVDDYGGINLGSMLAAQEGAAADGVLAFGSVLAASYTTLLVNTGRRRIITIYNTLDKAVLVSADATNAFAIVPPTTGFAIYNFGSNGLHIATSISVKAIGSNATSGEVRVAAVGA